MYPKILTPKKKYFIKVLFAICFSFLICSAFSEPVSTDLSIPDSKTGNLKNTADKQEEAQAEINSSTKENTLHSVWEISNPYYHGTAFAIGPNQIIASFYTFSLLLKSGDFLKDTVLTQSGSSSQIQIKKVLILSAFYKVAVFETKETVSNYLKLTKDFLDDPKEELSVVGYLKGVLTTFQKTGNIVAHKDSLPYFPVNTTNFDVLKRGSPILNIQNEVVGVAQGGSPNMLKFTKVSDIQKLLSEKESASCSSLSPVKCFEQEMRNLKKMSDQGNAWAQFEMSIAYMGNNILIYGDMNASFKLRKKAAKQGLVFAQYGLGHMYLNGIGTDNNIKLAAKWYRKAAEQGLALTQSQEELVYKEGLMETDVKQSLVSYTKKCLKSFTD